MLVDDYAHHPTEVEATLKAAKAGWDRRIIAVFQPHLFTRTQEFFREFAQVLQIADEVIITDIYPAREKPIPGVTSALIYDECSKKLKNRCHSVPDLDDLEKFLDTLVKQNDMVITLGAGSIWRYSESYATHLKTLAEGVKG
jgi:UDP-N-acetylmuramate--alanine ligase